MLYSGDLPQLAFQVLALMSRKNRESQGLPGGQTVDVSIFERQVPLLASVGSQRD